MVADPGRWESSTILWIAVSDELLNMDETVNKLPVLGVVETTLAYLLAYIY